MKEIDLVDLLEEERFGYDEEDVFDLKEEIIELKNRIVYAKSILSEHVDEETILEAFGE